MQICSVHNSHSVQTVCYRKGIIDALSVAKVQGSIIVVVTENAYSAHSCVM